MISRALFQRPWISLFCLLLSLDLILILFTFRDYGIPWDDEWHSTYGEYILNWYGSFFRDRAALDYWLLKYYGGFFEVVAQLLARISPAGVFETRHFVSALFGLLGMVGAFQLGKYLGGPAAGFLSALFLLLTPRFYGHAFINCKDLPFATLYLISLYYIIKSVSVLPRLPRELIWKLGMVLGLTLGIRIGGILLFGYLAFAFFVWVLVCGRPKEGGSTAGTDLRSALATFAKGCFRVGVMSYVVMLIWWPPAQAQPILHPLKALWKTSHFPWTREVFFEGRMVLATHLPWYYMPKWILITVPEFYLVGFAVGLGLIVLALSRSKRIYYNDRFVEYCVLLFAVLFPLTVAAVGTAVLYDAERHLLFVFPPLAVIAGVSVTTLVRQLGFKPFSATVAAAVLLSLALTAVDMVQLHPYEYVYFNRLFGKGLKHAAQSFETDYWGSSYKEGAEWVVRNYQGRFPDQKIKVASCSYPLSTRYYLPEDRFIYVGSYDYKVKDHPDVFLATTRWRCHETLNGRILHVVMRQATPLLYVKEIDKSARPARPY